MSGGGGWEWSDAWVLAAIMLGRDSDGLASLRDLVAAGDYINHAILRDDEVEQAVRRLLARELMTAEENGFRLTPAGEALVPQRQVYVLKHVDRLLTTLRREPVRQVPWQLHPGAWRNAIDDYARDDQGTVNA